MAPPPAELATLPENFPDLPVEQAVKVLLRAVTEHDRDYFDLVRRHAELVRWIESAP